METNAAEELAQLVNAPRYRPGPECGADLAIKAVGSLPNLTPEAVAAVVDNKSIAASKVADYLTKHGSKIAAQSVQRHRRRGVSSTGCSCPR